MRVPVLRYSAICALLAAVGLSPAATAVDGPVTFSKDVAPIFFNHCVACHRPGEVAPMSLLTYGEARPWAKAIAREITAKKMPPWSGESERHSFKNDISLSQEQIDTIVAWVESGTKRGDPSDMPITPTFQEGWKLGEPDYIITLNKIDVPASGDDLFPNQTVVIDIDEPKWVNAIEFMPTDRRVAHHTQMLYNSPAAATGDSIIGASNAAQTGILGIWTAGMQPFEFPEGVGRVLNPGTRIIVDSHYHPFGEATSDQARIGLYFGKGEMKKEVSTITVANMGLRIPPGEANHAEKAFYLFSDDMQIVAFSPHMHLRGKSMRYDLTYPDGHVENLLNVPIYNFNWQWLYYPEEPIDAPAGSRLDVTAVWDNSEGNPFNPDPSQEIIYRGNTNNEMFVGFFEAIPKNTVRHQVMPNLKKVASILEQHPADRCFLSGGFLPFGLYLPEEGEGWLYMAQGLIMFTISLDDYEWDGQHLSIRTQLPTPEASATLTIIEADIDENGRLKGMMKYGVDSKRTMTIPMLAKPMTEVNQSP